MRRTQWAVFTSMNPRPSAWRALYEPPQAAPQGDEAAVKETAPVAEPVQPSAAADVRYE